MAEVGVRRVIIVLMRGFLVIILLSCFLQSSEGLSVGFYNESCPGAETAIRLVVQSEFARNNSIAGHLLRLFFHDCFVQGCDASILINSTPGNLAEKEARTSLTVKGYDTIDTAKKAVESICPGMVSCADIIALAARDAVVEAGGTNYQLPCGRRDGFVSNASMVDLPGRNVDVAEATSAFEAKGLTQQDMVILLGAHSVGFTRCSLIASRLWNFQGTGEPDPTMDATLLGELRVQCPLNAGEGDELQGELAMDRRTPFKLDTSFYSELVARRGVLQMDQELATDPSTRNLTASLAGPGSKFTEEFSAAMIKLGNLSVLEGQMGEIRKFCWRINE